MGPIGFPELLGLPLLFLIWAAPILALVWVVWTLRQIRNTQTTMAAKLDALEMRLRTASDTRANP